MRIAQEYAREAGVRHYEKCLDKIHRKMVAELIGDADKKAADAIKQAKEEQKTAEEIGLITTTMFYDLAQTYTIDAPDLEKYLGKPVVDFIYLPEVAFDKDQFLKDVEKRIRAFINEIKKTHDGETIGIVAHRAPQLALEVITKNITWETAIKNDWRASGDWQPGWEYIID